MDAGTIAAVVDTVRAAGGIVRSAELKREGVPRSVIDVAVSSGALMRIRRTWVALPDADPFLVAAARTGTVLSCVTLAEQVGLWVMEVARPHVAAHAHAGRVAIETATVHRARPLLPRHPDQLTDSMENILALVAACQPFEAALAVWESALRHHLVDAAVLARLPLRQTAREILEQATPFSDSGLETFVVPRLRWLRVRILPQIWLAGHRVDFLIGDRLVLQIDGGHHVDAQREEDIRHDAELMARGYFVIRVGYSQMIDDWPSVQALIMTAIAQKLHLAAA